MRVGDREKVCYYDDRIQAGADVTFDVTSWGLVREGAGGRGAGREWEEGVERRRLGGSARTEEASCRSTELLLFVFLF